MSFNTNIGRQSFTASGGQTEFDFNFKIYAATDLKVYLTPVGQDPNDTNDLLIYGTEYTVTIDGDNGGMVTLLSAATLNDILVFERVLPRVRDISYVTNGDLLAATLNLDQDYQTYMLIDDFNTADRSISLPSTDVTMSPELPPTVFNGYLRVKSDGSGFEYDETVPQAVVDTADNVLNANSWANEDEDVPVKVYTNGVAADRVPMVYSAKHYRIEAEDYKDGAQLEKWDAEAKALTSINYATEVEDILVNVVTSDGDGTFTYTPQTGVYSSLHYAAKAEGFASSMQDTIDYVTNNQSAIDNNLDSYIHVKDYGAVGDGITDDTVAIQNALDAAAAKDGRCVVSLGGDKYKVTAPLYIKTDVVLKDGTLLYVGTADNTICLNIGTTDGQYLVRVGGIENVVVDCTSDTNAGTTAFNLGHLARGNFINNCRAMTNTGVSPSNRGHIGFSIYGVKDDLTVTGSGIYQNSINNCTTYNADIAYRIDTAGYGLAGFAPQANGNFLKSCSAYSCTTSALYIGEGGQENICEVRADTFVNQTGLGTTIKVLDLKGSYNEIMIFEEIGARADTQYTVSVSGDNAKYNNVKYQTQQVVTSVLSDTTTGTAKGKNILKSIREKTLNGGDTFSISGYYSATAGTANTYDAIVLPSKCKLIKAVAKNVFTPTTYTRLYFAKSGVIDTLQRLTWGNTDAAYTTKTLSPDTSDSGTIDDRFIYNEGDYIPIRIDQDASGGNTVLFTLYFKTLY